MDVHGGANHISVLEDFYFACDAGDGEELIVLVKLYAADDIGRGEQVCTVGQGGQGTEPFVARDSRQGGSKCVQVACGPKRFSFSLVP